MNLLFLDSETCGLHSMMVLLQYAEDDGPIVLYNIWKEPVGKTLDLLEWIASKTVVGFNLAFDWFHVAKIYTIWRLLPRDWIPEEHIEQIALLEPLGQDGPCIKPFSACDLLLHSRKNEFQSLMAREDIRIRRVPTALAYVLAEELEQRVEIDGIFFARSADPDAPKWKVYDIFKHGELDPDFKDVCLKFNPAGGLKFLAEYALGYKPKFHFTDVEPPKDSRPVEFGYAPTALSVSTPDQDWAVYEEEDGKYKLKGHAWPAKIKTHIDHWADNEPAREYASDDILYTRELYKHFKCPVPGDDDSILATMVPIVRWRGFKIDVTGMQALCEAARQVVANAPVRVTRPQEVRAYLTEVMDDTEAMFIEDTTKKAKLEAIVNWIIEEEEECTACFAGDPTVCKRCSGAGKLKPGKHPAAARARELLDVKHAVKEIELYEKLIRACKFHASFNVIGTMSSRMSGGDGLNAQGIKKTKEVRMNFPLAWAAPDLSLIRDRLEAFLGLDDEALEAHWHYVKACYLGVDFELCGGDFDAFEVTLADAVYNDPQLRKALVTKVPCHKCEGRGKIDPCKPCKGKGKNKETGLECKTCEGRGRFIIIDDEQFEKVLQQLIDCGGCEGLGLTTKKIHGLFGMALFPGKTYEEILASDGSKELDMYTLAKSGVFAMIYGGNADTLHKNLGVSKEVAQAAFEQWGRMFPGIEKARNRILRNFCSMRQMANRQVVWAEPADYCETFLGFRRYFTLENKICKALFDLANKPPPAWRKCPVKVVRRDRIQTAGGAVSSALYGSAFAIQQANMRAASNHEIQSPGGQITKHVQRRIWDLQPCGVHPLYVAPMNIHDELQCVTHPDYVEPVAQAVKEGVESFRDKVALIGMTWNKAMANWAEKKGGTVTLKIQPPEMNENGLNAHAA